MSQSHPHLAQQALAWRGGAPLVGDFGALRPVPAAELSAALWQRRLLRAEAYNLGIGFAKMPLPAKLLELLKEPAKLHVFEVTWQGQSAPWGLGLWSHYTGLGHVALLPHSLSDGGERARAWEAGLSGPQAAGNLEAAYLALCSQVFAHCPALPHVWIHLAADAPRLYTEALLVIGCEPGARMLAGSGPRCDSYLLTRAVYNLYYLGTAP